MNVGAELRRAREARKLTLADVTRETKIQPWVLEALEADRLPELMSPVYVKSFLISYAKYLRLEHEPLLAQFSPPPVEAEPNPQPSPAPRPTAQIPVAWHIPQIPLPALRRIGVVVAASAVIAVVVAVNPLRALHKVSLPKVSLPKLAMPKLKMPTRVAKRPAPVKAPAVRVITPKLASVTPITEPLTPTPPPLPTLQPTQPLELVVTAQRTTWIQVRADGKLLAEQRISRGANERWTAKKTFEVVIAYPSQVEIMLNGQSISPFAIANRGRLMITHRGITQLPEKPQ